MPLLKRRRLLQVMTAATLTPALPMASVAAPATSVPSGGAPMAKLLWAGLHKQAGSAAGLSRLAQSFGLPAGAAHAVARKTASAHVLSMTSERSSAFERRIRKWLFEEDAINEDPKPESNADTPSSC